MQDFLFFEVIHFMHNISFMIIKLRSSGFHLMMPKIKYLVTNNNSWLSYEYLFRIFIFSLN